MKASIPAHRISLICLFVVCITPLLVGGCTKSGAFRFNGARDLQDARNIGAGVTWVTVDSNVQEASISSTNGQQVGTCPYKFEFVHDPTSAQTWGPGGMFEIGGPKTGYAVYFFGTVSAQGYQPRSFRVRVKEGNQGATTEQYVKVDLFPYQHSVSPAPPQEQQQQQQTVIVPQVNTGSQGSPSGNVLITSNKDGCEVYVDGAFVGNTPTKLKLQEGIHIIEIKKEGYNSYKKELRMFSGSDLALKAMLQ